MPVRSLVASQAIWMQAPPGGVQIPQLALQHTVPGAQRTEPQVGGASGTQLQTCGDESKCAPILQSTFCRHTHMPLQSAPEAPEGQQKGLAFGRFDR